MRRKKDNESRELTGYQSIDKPWLKYYGEEVLHRPLPEGSMYDYLTSCNVDRLDSAALNYFGKKGYAPANAGED